MKDGWKRNCKWKDAKDKENILGRDSLAFMQIMGKSIMKLREKMGMQERRSYIKNKASPNKSEPPNETALKQWQKSKTQRAQWDTPKCSGLQSMQR